MRLLSDSDRFFSRARAKGYIARACALAFALAAIVLGPIAGLSAKDGGPKKAVGADLRGASPKDRHAAVEDLIYGRGEAAENEVLDALHAEPEPGLRAQLLRALNKRPTKDSTAALIETLGSDPSDLVRVAAAQELGRLRGGKPARDALIGALKGDRDKYVREAAVAALAGYHDKAVVTALAAAAKDGDKGLKTMAALALSRQPAGKDRDKALDGLTLDKDRDVAAKAKKWRGKKPAKKSGRKSGKNPVKRRGN